MRIRACGVIAVAVACCACRSHDESAPPQREVQPAEARPPGSAAPPAAGVDVAARPATTHAATEPANEAVVDAPRTQDTVAQIRLDLAALEARLDQLMLAAPGATSDAERAAVQAQLAEIAKQRAALQQRILAAKAAAAEAQRASGAHITQECLDNPLAKGCS
ncbi:MAG TPA: hypothetical protein VGD37_13480 [Kofleriaceae bacterium]|jgi:hypothetical protein